MESEDTSITEELHEPVAPAEAEVECTKGDICMSATAKHETLSSYNYLSSIIQKCIYF